MKNKTFKKWLILGACLLVVVAVTGFKTVSAMVQQTAIGEERAENFAFADAGIDPATARDVDADFTFAQGQFVYEVEFDSEGTHYEYLIKADDGTVVKKLTRIMDVKATDATTTDPKPGETAQPVTPPTGELTVEEAKAAALKDAGVQAGEAVFTKAKKEWEDGKEVFDIEFAVGTTEYSYEISLQGEILERDVDREDDKKPEVKPEVKPTEPPATAEKITVAQAKEIALKHAGLTAAEVTFEKAKLEKDDGVWEYEIEFFKGRMEYEYTIHATTGKILEHDAEIDD